MTLRTKIITAVTAAAMATLLLAGCSSAPSDGVASIDKPKSAAPTEGPGGSSFKKNEDAKDGNLAFFKCLREKGLDVEDPAADGSFSLPEQGGKSQDEVNTIIKACQPEIPGGTSGGGTPQLAEAFKKLGKCMRENGFPDFKDPDPSGGAIDLGQVDANDPKFKEAQKKCLEPLFKPQN